MKTPFLTLDAIAVIEGMHLKTVYKRAKLGKIPGAQQIGRSWRVNREKYAKARGLSPEQIA